MPFPTKYSYWKEKGKNLLNQKIWNFQGSSPNSINSLRGILNYNIYHTQGEFNSKYMLYLYMYSNKKYLIYIYVYITIK